MILLFELVILTFILVIGFKISTQPGMIFEKIGNWANAKIDKGYKVFNLLVCPWCMNSLFSLPAMVFAYGIGVIYCFTWNLLWYYPLVVGLASFISGMTWTIYLTMNSKKEYYDNAQKFYYLSNKKMKKELTDNG